MSLGNDLDSKIVLIYQEYMKRQQDEKIAARVYTSEESFRNGLEEVIKLNGIVDKNEFYTAIAFEIQNGNFFISNDGKIDMTAESITKAVERAKEKENKNRIIQDNLNKERNKQNDNNEEKGILGITQIKTMDDAKKVLSARIRKDELTPERKKLCRDAMKMALSETMDSEKAESVAEEVIDVVTNSHDNFMENVVKVDRDGEFVQDYEAIGALSEVLRYNRNGIDTPEYDVQDAIGMWKYAKSVMSKDELMEFKQYLMGISEKFGELNDNCFAFVAFATVGENNEISFEYVTKLIKDFELLKESGVLISENAEIKINAIFKEMIAKEIEITDDMRKAREQIIKNPSAILETNARNNIKLGIVRDFSHKYDQIIEGYSTFMEKKSTLESYDDLQYTPNNFGKTSYIAQNGKKTFNIAINSMGEGYIQTSDKDSSSSEVDFVELVDKYKKEQYASIVEESEAEKSEEVQEVQPEGDDLVNFEISLESDLMLIGDGEPDAFAALFGDMAEDMLVGDSEPVLEEDGVDLEGAATPMVEYVVVEDVVPREDIQHEVENSEQNAIAVDTTSNRIKRGLMSLGKKIAEAAKGVFGKIANAFNGSNNSGSNNGTSSNAGQGVNIEEKPAQVLGSDNILNQHFDLDLTNLNSKEAKGDEGKGGNDPKSTDDRGDEEL